MKTATVEDMQARFSTYLKATEEGLVVVMRKGKPVAALISVSDQDDLERLAMAHSPKLQAILSAARERLRAGAGIPRDEFWQQVAAESAARTRKPSKPRKNGRTNGRH